MTTSRAEAIERAVTDWFEMLTDDPEAVHQRLAAIQDALALPPDPPDDLALEYAEYRDTTTAEIKHRDAEIEQLTAERDELDAANVGLANEAERLRSGLRIIAGYEQCIDPLMGNVDIARRTLEEKP